MKKLLLILSAAVCGIANAQVPNWIWAQGYGGSKNDIGNGISADGNRNIYVAGKYYSAGITIGNSISNADGSGNTSDIFVAKLNPAGTAQWSKTAGTGVANDAGTCITTDASGYIYASGYFASSTITFGSTTLNHKGSGDIFLVKYDSTGIVKWAKSYGNTGSDFAMGITVDKNCNIYITGFYNSSKIGFDSDTIINTVSGYSEIFLTKVDSSGNVLWANSYGGTNEDGGSAVCVDSLGNVCMAGYFQSASVSFGSTTLTNTSGYRNSFVVKCDSNGNPIWAIKGSGPNQNEVKGITADMNGDFYACGYYVSSVTFGSVVLNNISCCDHLFLIKINSSGNTLWGKRGGGANGDVDAYSVINAGSNVYITGSSDGCDIWFDTDTLVNNACLYTDGFLAGYNSATGTELLVKGIAGNGTYPVNNSEGGYGITADNNGNIIFTGYYDSNTLTLGSTTLTNASPPKDDLIIGKLGAVYSASISPVNVQCNGQCNGSATCNVYAGNSPYTYLWNTNETTQIITGLCQGNYSVSVTDASSTVTTATVTITQPAVFNVIPPSSSSVCIGSCATISANVSGGSGNYTYLWSPGNLTTNPVILCPTSNTNYSVTVNDICGVQTNSFSISVNPIPTANAGSDVSICPGKCATLTASGGVTYSWSPSSGLSCTTCANPTACPTSTQTYSLTVTDANNCTASDNITVTKYPNLSITITASPQTICAGQSSTITATGGISYSWYSGQTTSTIVVSPTSNQNYIVVVTDANGCTGTSLTPITVIICTGVAESKHEDDVMIYPNPSSGIFTISTSAKNYEIEIANVLGEKVYSTQLPQSTQSTQLTINLSDKPDGVYFLQLKTEQGIATKKIVISH